MISPTFPLQLCTVLQKTLEVSVGQATLTPSVQSAADIVYPSDAQSGEAVQFNAALDDGMPLRLNTLPKIIKQLFFMTNLSIVQYLDPWTTNHTGISLPYRCNPLPAGNNTSFRCKCAERSAIHRQSQQRHIFRFAACIRSYRFYKCYCPRRHRFGN